MTKYILNDRADAWKTETDLFFYNNKKAQIINSYVSFYFQWKLSHERSAVIVKSSMIGAKLNRLRLLFNLFKMAANKSSRKHNVTGHQPGDGRSYGGGTKKPSKIAPIVLL